MNEILLTILITVGVSGIFAAWNIFASREQTVIWGWKSANFLGIFLGAKIGIQYGRSFIERIKNTFVDYAEGYRLWLEGKPKPEKSK